MNSNVLTLTKTMYFYDFLLQAKPIENLGGTP